MNRKQLQARRNGGAARTEKKAAASAANGRKGGRPKFPPRYKWRVDQKGKLSMLCYVGDQFVVVPYGWEKVSPSGVEGMVDTHKRQYVDGLKRAGASAELIERGEYFLANGTWPE